VKGGGLAEASSMNLKDSEKKLLQRIFSKHNLVSEEDYEEILEIYDKNKANFINRIISQGYIKTPRLFPILAKELNLKYCSYQSLIWSQLLNAARTYFEKLVTET